MDYNKVAPLINLGIHSQLIVTVINFYFFPIIIELMFHCHFKAMDKNGDGKISLREYVDYLTNSNNAVFTHPKIFRALDKDNNGSLDFGKQSSCTTSCLAVELYFASVVIRSWQTCTSAAFNVSVLMSQLAPMIFVVLVMVENGSLTTMMPSSGITILY